MTSTYEKIKKKAHEKANALSSNHTEDLEKKITEVYENNRDATNISEFKESIGKDIIEDAFTSFRDLIKKGDKTAINTCIQKLFANPKPKNSRGISQQKSC